MLIKAFHASPVRFDEFKMQRGGLHFGGLGSALQAVERHLLDDGSFYLYEVLIDCTGIQDIFDCADADGWELEKQLYGHKVCSYKNEYEPCSDKSYVVFCTSRIKIVNCTLKNINDYHDDLFYWR